MAEVTRKVEDIMSGTVLYEALTANVLDVIGLIHRNNADAIIVNHNGVPIGMITENEIIRGLVRSGEGFPRLAAKDIMRSVVSVGNIAGLIDARDAMIANNVSKVVVKRNEDIIGCLTQKDLLNYLV